MFNLLLANITNFYVLLFLTPFLPLLNNFFISSVDNEYVRLRLALAVPTGVPIVAEKDAIEMLPLVADKTINHNKQYIC